MTDAEAHIGQALEKIVYKILLKQELLAHKEQVEQLQVSALRTATTAMLLSLPLLLSLPMLLVRSRAHKPLEYAPRAIHTHIHIYVCA